MRDGVTVANPKADFRLRPGDDAIVVAESLGTLSPLDPENALDRDETDEAGRPRSGLPAVPPAPDRWRRAPSAS